MAPNREQRGSNSSLRFLCLPRPGTPSSFLSFHSYLSPVCPRFPEIKFYSFNRIQLEHFPRRRWAKLRLVSPSLIANAEKKERKSSCLFVPLNFKTRIKRVRNPCDLSRNFVELIEKKKERKENVPVWRFTSKQATPNNGIKKYDTKDNRMYPKGLHM